jgi:hypothetical protein
VSSVIAVHSVRNYYNKPQITLLDGTKAKGLSVAEVGEYAGPGFMDAQIRYLTNLKAYQTLTFTPVTSDTPTDKIAAAILPHLRVALSRNVELKSLATEDLTRSLATAFALRIRRGAGWDLDNYQASTGASISLPEPLEDKSYLHDVFRSDIAIPSNNDKPAVAALAKNLEELSIHHRGLDDRWVAIADDKRAFRAVIVSVSPDGPVDDILDPYLDDKERNFFRGSMGQGQLVFSQHTKGIGSPIRSEVTCIVKSKSGDIYPVAFRFYLNKSGRWDLCAAIRFVSIRVSEAPPRVFQ